MTETASERRRRVASEIVVDADLCKTCGICLALCPRDVFTADERGLPLVAHLEACTVCRICEYHCPDFAIAISWREEPRGVTEESPHASEGRSVAGSAAAAAVGGKT
jgi:2-oxoglutarate ferredoxin oxidoreductase subunit delta